MGAFCRKASAGVSFSLLQAQREASALLTLLHHACRSKVFRHTLGHFRPGTSVRDGNRGSIDHGIRK